jgi:hypothetical protein
VSHRSGLLLAPRFSSKPPSRCAVGNELGSMDRCIRNDDQWHCD